MIKIRNIKFLRRRDHIALIDPEPRRPRKSQPQHDGQHNNNPRISAHASSLARTARPVNIARKRRFLKKGSPPGARKNFSRRCTRGRPIEAPPAHRNKPFFCCSF